MESELTGQGFQIEEVAWPKKKEKELIACMLVIRWAAKKTQLPHL